MKKMDNNTVAILLGAIALSFTIVLLRWTALLYPTERLKIFSLNLGIYIMFFALSKRLFPNDDPHLEEYVIFAVISSVIIFILNPPEERIIRVKSRKISRQLTKFRDHLDTIRNEILLAMFNGKKPEDIIKQIDNAVASIVNVFIPDTLQLLSDPNDKIHPKISYLQGKEDGTFAIVSQWKVEPFHIPAIEEKFRHHPEPIGLAGFSYVNKETINVTDLLSTKALKYRNRWVALDPNDEPPRSFFCKPIVIGRVKLNTSKSVAVICVSASSSHLWVENEMEGVMNVFGEELETLYYLKNLCKLRYNQLLYNRESDESSE